MSNSIPNLRSNCCEASIKTEGEYPTYFYVCLQCKKACDPKANSLYTEAKIRIDFADGSIRNYEIVADQTTKYPLSKGGKAVIEFCHPNSGEMMIVRMEKMD